MSSYTYCSSCTCFQPIHAQSAKGPGDTILGKCSAPVTVKQYCHALLIVDQFLKKNIKVKARQKGLDALQGRLPGLQGQGETHIHTYTHTYTPTPYTSYTSICPLIHPSVLSLLRLFCCLHQLQIPKGTVHKDLSKCPKCGGPGGFDSW